jgi:hypothetical protein
MRADAHGTPARRFETRTESSGRPSRSTRPLFVLFSCLGILMGLFAREMIDSAGEAVGPAERVVAAGRSDAESGENAADPASTIVVQVNAVLSLPTETPAPTETPRPSATATREAALDFCGAVPAEEGAVCRMPNPTATATATLPACFSPQAVDGHLCQYRLTPTPEPSSSTALRWGQPQGQDT